MIDSLIEVFKDAFLLLLLFGVILVVASIIGSVHSKWFTLVLAHWQRWALGVVGVVLLAIAIMTKGGGGNAPVEAQVDWFPANGTLCSKECGNYDLNAVITGHSQEGSEYQVCAAAVVGGGSGKRIGFVTPTASGPRCHVFSGGFDGGEKLESYSCLCSTQKVEKP